MSKPATLSPFSSLEPQAKKWPYNDSIRLATCRPLCNTDRCHNMSKEIGLKLNQTIQKFPLEQLKAQCVIPGLQCRQSLWTYSIMYAVFKIHRMSNLSWRSCIYGCRLNITAPFTFRSLVGAVMVEDAHEDRNNLRKYHYLWLSDWTKNLYRIGNVATISRWNKLYWLKVSPQIQ